MLYSDKVEWLTKGTISHKGNPEEVLKTNTISLYNTPVESIETSIRSGDKRRELITV